MKQAFPPLALALVAAPAFAQSPKPITSLPPVPSALSTDAYIAQQNGVTSQILESQIAALLAGTGLTVTGGSLSVNCSVASNCSLGPLASFTAPGTASTVLHGNAGGSPTWGPVNLGTDVTGTLPAGNLPAASSSAAGICQFGSTAGACIQGANQAANPLDFGANPNSSGAGSSDNSTAIQNAINSTVNGQSRNTYLRSGTYHIAHALTLTGSECLIGDGLGSVLDIDSDFDSTATGVVNLTAVQGSNIGPCVYGIRFVFHQPTGSSTTTTASQTAGNNTIVVSSSAGMLVGNAIGDSTAPAAIPAGTTITAISGTTVTLSASVASPGVGSGNTIIFSPSRAQFASLGSCTTTANGTGCKYPPAIYAYEVDRTRVNGNRFEGAWTAYQLLGASGHTNGGSWFQNNELGEFSVGINIDQNFDVAHVDHNQCWPYGYVNDPVYTLVGADGNNYCAQIGQSDGIEISDLTSISLRVQLTSNFTFGRINGLTLDLGADLEVANSGNDGLHISGLLQVGTPIASGECGINVSGGVVYISDFTAGVGANGNKVCYTGGGGMLSLDHGTISTVAGDTGNAIYAPNGAFGTLRVHGTSISAPTAATPAINVTGNSKVDIQGNRWETPASGSSVGVYLANDTAYNIVANNLLNGWTFAAPGASGTYQLASMSPNLTAAGTTQGTATAASYQVNYVGTVAAGTGVILPKCSLGQRIVVMNEGANALLVYPPVGWDIYGYATNNPVSIPAGTIQALTLVNGLTFYPGG